jgi:hypothetical protein
MQLDLFIRSFNHCIANAESYKIKVLYMTTHDDFEEAYDKLKVTGYKNVEFIRELEFRNDLLGMFENVPYTVFFVDDIVVKRHVDLFDEQMDIFNSNSQIICRSLRLGWNMLYCYPADVVMTPPAFTDKGIFRWRGLPGDYGYPMSVDGHIFRTNEIYKVISDIEFKCPNTMEGEMQGKLGYLPLMICYKESVVFNNPINKVQYFNNNKHGDVNPVYLNAMYMSGKRIMLEPFIGLKNHSCHQEMELNYEVAPK